MKKHTVIAKTKGVAVGRKEIALGETMAELKEIHGSDEAIIKLVNQAYTTNTRNALATPAGTSVLRKHGELFDRLSFIAPNLTEVQKLNAAEMTKEDLAEYRKMRDGNAPVSPAVK